MKLLLDQNVSYRVLGELEVAFPGSTQVRLIKLDTADDKTIWEYARDHGFTIVSQDSDFHELAMYYGVPPKVIWLKCGNRPRWYVAALLLSHKDRIIDFGDDPGTAVLEVY